MMRFQPRHAFVTGAAGAIGGALAKTLAHRHAELRLSLVDQNETGIEKLMRSLSGRGAALSCDLGDISTLPSLWERATANFGPVDLLINCAGFMELRSFSATSWELGERLLRVDLLAPLRLMNLAVPAMAAAGAGAIVNISSMAGRVPIRGASYYGAAKSGLAVASDIATRELAPQGIHVLTVFPGPVHSYLERRSRSQLPPNFLAQNIPTGDPAALAERIEHALQRGTKRLVYPRVYAIADRFIGLASRVALPLSPSPTDAP
jgi:short-subunit dehydrogenase